jgi:hypothetical protein
MCVYISNCSTTYPSRCHDTKYTKFFKPDSEIDIAHLCNFLTAVNEDIKGYLESNLWWVVNKTSNKKKKLYYKEYINT